MALQNLQQYGCQTGNKLKEKSRKITPPKTPNSGQFSYPLPNIVYFYFD
jgi:hypothetical protein